MDPATANYRQHVERAAWDALELTLLPPEGGLQLGGSGLAPISEPLAAWVQRNVLALPGAASGSQLCKQLRRRSLWTSSPVPESELSYWQLLRVFVALGCWEHAVELLERHSAWQRGLQMDPKAFDVLDLLKPFYLLVKMAPRLLVVDEAPMDSGAAAGRFCATLPEFQLERRRFTAACSELLGEKGEARWEGCRQVSPATCAGIESVLGVLLGDREAIEESTGNWMELAVRLRAALLRCYRGAGPSPAVMATALLGERARERGMGGTALVCLVSRWLRSSTV